MKRDPFPALRALAAKRGYHLVRGDFYSPVPDAWPAELWEHPAPTPGVDLALDAAELLLQGLAPYIAEYDIPTPPGETKHGYRIGNHFYPHVDAEILYSMLRSLRPQRLVEIGAGWSSRVVADALDVNAVEDAPTREHRIFDPFPAEHLRSLGADVEALPAERIPDDVFAALGQGDVLFIDTTHTLKPGNDVVRLLLEVIPQLAAGVSIHVHDIFLPYCYPRFLFDAGYHWQEQYLLQALLVGNPSIRVTMPTYALFRDRPDAIEAAVPGMTSHTLGSGFWLETA